MSKDYRNLYRGLHLHPIAYDPIYRLVAGNTTGGVLLSQIMYWFSKKDKYFQKDKEFRKQTFLTEDEFKSAKKKIKALPFLTIKAEGNPVKTWYTIDWDKWEKYMTGICDQIQTENETGEGGFDKWNLHNSKSGNSTIPRIINNTHTKTNIKLHSSPASGKVLDQTKLTIWERMATTFLKSIPIKRSTTPNMKSWGITLSRFCKKIDIDKPRIKKILRWYCNQFDKDKNPYSQKYLPKYIPQATSMQGFVDKFVDIEISMLRQMEENGDTPDEPKTQLTKEEKKYLTSMKSNFTSINNCQKDTLPILVKEIKQELDLSLQKLHDSDTDPGLKKIYEDSLFSDRVFFIGYSMWINKEIKSWPEWGGDFKNFSPKGKNFNRYFYGIVKQKQWTPRLIKEILDGTN